MPIALKFDRLPASKENMEVGAACDATVDPFSFT